MSDLKTLEAAEYYVSWLIRYYDVLPPSADPHVTDVVRICKNLLSEIKALEADWEEFRPKAFACGRIQGRT